MIDSTEMSTRDRRSTQRELLIDSAERTIRTQGLGALKARDLARSIGCAVGAIYNLVTDLDELVLLVARRTARDLGAHLDVAAAQVAPSDPIDVLFIAWALAYFRFARDDQARWQALFTFRLPAGTPLPDWFEQDQAALFHRLEDRLAPLMPSVDAAVRKIKARVLFSAIHGIVVLGLEEKFVSMPIAAIETELEHFVRAYLKGIRDG